MLQNNQEKLNDGTVVTYTLPLAVYDESGEVHVIHEHSEDIIKAIQACTLSSIAMYEEMVDVHGIKPAVASLILTQAVFKLDKGVDKTIN